MRCYRFLYCVFFLFIFSCVPHSSVIASESDISTVEWYDLPSTFNIDDDAFLNGDLQLKNALLEWRDIGQSYTQVAYDVMYSDELGKDVMTYVTSTNSSLNSYRSYRHVLQFSSVSGASIVDSNSEVKFVVNNIACNYVNGTSARVVLDDPTRYYVVAYDTSGVLHTITDFCTISLVGSELTGGSANWYNLTLTVSDIEYDISMLQFVFSFSTANINHFSNASSSYGVLHCYPANSVIEYVVVDDGAFDEEVDETNGWLETIFNYVKSIWESVVSIPTKLSDMLSNIRQGFSEMVTNLQQGFINLGNFILNLPGQIVDAFVGFFLPSEDDLKVYWDKWDNLLSDHLGVMYEAPKIVNSITDSMASSASVSMFDNDDIIYVPVVEYDLVGVTFTFGGYAVDLVPDGLEILQDISRLITSIVCTLLFLNALSDKYNSLIGGGR